MIETEFARQRQRPLDDQNRYSYNQNLTSLIAGLLMGYKPIGRWIAGETPP